MQELRNITFIGGGNMARSLIGGLIGDGYTANAISVSDPNITQLNLLQDFFPIDCQTQASALIAQADCVVFAVKPQILQQAIKENLAALQQRKPLLVSIAAGVRMQSMRRWLGEDFALVRCAPNTPALVQAGATALYANDIASTAQKTFVESIMRAVGLTLWFEHETDLDIITALSGSGPAYFFLLMEAMQAAAEKMGLSNKQARLFTLQTAFGAAKIALESEETPAALRQRVTSKRGTTESALQVFNSAGFTELVEHALQAAHARARELGDLLDQD